MDYKKYKLKELISIVRQNGKVKEVNEHLNIKDIKYAKKKPLIEFLDTLQLQEIKPQVVDEIIQNDELTFDKDPVGEDEEPIIHLDLENIKNKKTKKKIIVSESSEEIQKKEDARNKIKVLYNRYPWLKNENVNINDPIGSHVILSRRLAVKNSEDFLKQSFFAVCGTCESLCVSTPIINDYVKLNGFTETLQNMSSIDDILDEMIIKYAPDIGGEGIPVEIRLCVAVLATIREVDKSNKKQDEIKKDFKENQLSFSQIKNRPIPESLIKKRL